MSEMKTLTLNGVTYDSFVDLTARQSIVSADNIDKAVSKYLTENPVSGGLTKTEKNLILTLFRNAAYTSANMGNTLTQLETIWDGSGDAHSHSYTSSVTTAATCTTSGVRTYTCNCGHSYTESIPATGHNYVDGVCTVCGATDPTYKPDVTLTSISATYAGGSVPVGTSVNALTGIVVTAHYSDGTSEAVAGYTISGTIAEGSNTITVSYGGKTTTFTVTGYVETWYEHFDENNLVNVNSQNGFTTVDNVRYYRYYAGAKNFEYPITNQQPGEVKVTLRATPQYTTSLNASIILHFSDGSTWNLAVIAGGTSKGIVTYTTPANKTLTKITGNYDMENWVLLDMSVMSIKAKYPPVTLTSISATYSGSDVPAGIPVTSLAGLSVIATYSDGSTATVTGYTLSGTIAEGNNTITVSYHGKTTTCTVIGVSVDTGFDVETITHYDTIQGYPAEIVNEGFIESTNGATTIYCEVNPGDFYEVSRNSTLSTKDRFRFAFSASEPQKDVVTMVYHNFDNQLKGIAQAPTDANYLMVYVGGTSYPTIPDGFTINQLIASGVVLVGISATYTGGDVAVGTAVSALTGVTVIANYSDGTSKNVTGYTLSGTIAEGNNTITVSYGGKTTTFTVTGIADATPQEYLYRLENRTFDGRAASVVDTGLELLKTDQSFTIMFDADSGVYNTGLTGQNIFACMSATDPWPGMLMKTEHEGGAQVKWMNVVQKEIPYNMSGSRIKVVITHEKDSGSATYRVNIDGTVNEYTLTDAFVPIDRKFAIGGSISGNNPFVGTVHSFTIYNKVMDDATISAFLA